MENDILWHYRFPHDGWEYDGAVTELHAAKPAGVEDPYTPDGIADPVKPGPDADIGKRSYCLGRLAPDVYRPNGVR